MPVDDPVSGPLAGIRMLDLTRLLPGSFCSLLPADHGADAVPAALGYGPEEIARFRTDGGVA